MRLLIVFAVVALIAFVGVNAIFPDSLPAVIAASAVAFLYLIVAAVHFTKPPVPSKVRIVALAFIGVSMGSQAMPFIEGHDTGYWQRSVLLGVRNVISAGVLQAVISQRAVTVLKEYHSPLKPAGETFSQTFDRLNPRVAPGSDIIIDEIFQNQFAEHPRSPDSLWSYISVSTPNDSEVVLTGINAIQERQQQQFAALKLDVPSPMPVARITPKGVSYER